MMKRQRFSNSQESASNKSKPEQKKTDPVLKIDAAAASKAESWGDVRLGCIAGIFFAVILCAFAPHVRELAFSLFSAKQRTTDSLPADIGALKKEQAQLQREVAQLRRRSDRLTPSSPFLIVSSSDNQFRLMQGKKVIRQGVCSTGSNVLLKTSDDRRWIFRTPTGVLRIKDKQKSPIWRKPDWAFIEEGKAVPAPAAEERFDFGALGEYGLYLGDGYLIHGTLYQRMLGMPVTHGCIRLGDDDLKAVYLKLGIGAKVFIY
ncbi:L,D-transpeptidase [candidate division KSB1 bacterium]|nr:L,D-transpeptidase [candidate division KSB1 bacterium]RQW05172.1 MAG: L,D-transpeptidase [candidate division KSB1 bacterium]